MAKQTFTYAAELKIKERAAKKAKKEGLTLSERIAQFLSEYTSDKNGKLLVVYAIDWTESERGWGQRPDGTTLYKSRAEAEAHIQKDANSKKDTEVPDCYSFPGDPYFKEVSKSLYDKVMSSKEYIWA